jgi:hypothetical protein
LCSSAVEQTNALYNILVYISGAYSKNVYVHFREEMSSDYTILREKYIYIIKKN